MIEIYIAKDKMMFGIRKNDEIEYDTVAKTSLLKRTGKLLPFDAKKEAAFFNYQPPKPKSTYQINDMVHLTAAMSLEIIGGIGYKTPGRIFKIAAYQPMKIVDVVIDTRNTYQRKRKNDYYYVTEIGKYRYKCTVKEPILALTEYYWFISSKGSVNRDIIGKDAKVDAFRAKMKNYFKTQKDAADAFSKL